MLMQHWSSLTSMESERSSTQSRMASPRPSQSPRSAQRSLGDMARVTDALTLTLTLTLTLHPNPNFNPNPNPNPSQLPCAHFVCTACLKRLFPVGKMGLDCPVCRRNYPKWVLQRHEGSPGGVALAEMTR